MGVPSVVRLLPAGSDISNPVEGPTAGSSLVEIYGNNFRLPPASGPGPTGTIVAGMVVDGEVPKTVSVTFGGVEALRVDVVKSNLLHVLTPKTPLAATPPDYGTGDVDVVITNLDDAGDPIPGESVTVPDGYSYRRPRIDATATSDLTRLITTFAEAWIKEVLANTMVTVSVDFDSDTGTPEIDIASMPAIVLQLTAIPENKLFDDTRRPDEAIGDNPDELRTVEIRNRPRTFDLEFDVVGVDNNTERLLNLLHACQNFMRDNTSIQMDRDPDDPSKGTVEYELDYQTGGAFTTALGNNASDIRSFSGSVVIRGFQVEGWASFKGSALHDLSATHEEGPILTVTRYDT